MFRVVPLFLKYLSSWLLVLLTAERVIYILLPYNATIHTKKCGMFSIMIVGTVLLLFITVLANYGTHFNLECALTSCVFLFMTVFIEFLLPSVLIMSGNFIILHHLYMRRRQVKTTREVMFIRTTIMLMCCTVWFVMCSIPFVYREIQLVLKDGFAIQPEFRQVVLLFLLCNHASNFYIFIITSQQYRQNLAKMFKCRNKVSPQG